MMLSRLQARPRLILDVLQYEHQVSGHVEQFKAIVILVDGSRLHVNEVWLRNVLRKYAHYWLTVNGELIQGWDNAPHHPQITTYPDHSHTPEQVHSSSIRTLDDLLNELEQRLL